MEGLDLESDLSTEELVHQSFATASEKLAESSSILRDAWRDVEPRLKSLADERKSLQGEICSLRDSLQRLKNAKNESVDTQLSLEESLLMKSRFEEIEKDRDSRADHETTKEMQSFRAMKLLDEKQLCDEILSLTQSLGDVKDQLRSREGQVDELSREKKFFAESLEVLQQRCTALEQDAQSILHEYIEEDAETHLQKLAGLISTAIEATSLIIWELRPEHKDHELDVSKMMEIATHVNSRLRVWKLSAAFEGTGERWL